MVLMDKNIIDDLIEYGKSNTFNSDTLVNFSKQYRGKVAPVMSPDYWLDIARSLHSAERLTFLIKGMLSFYNTNQIHTGGSVSPIRWLYQYVREAYSEHEPKICEWIVKNRNNKYEPFGSIYSNTALSWKEFCLYEMERKK